MAKAIKVPLKKANEVKRYLLDKRYLDKKHSYLKEDKYIYFPVVSKPRELQYEVIDIKLNSIPKETSLKKALSEFFSDEELERLKTAYDVVGDIAILEIDEEFIKKEKIIGATLLSLQKNIKTVLKKAGMHEGEFRTQAMDCIAGEDKRVTIHKENNVKLKLDVEKVYFSARSATERKRISEHVKEGESVLVMFSGCGPFVFVIAKNTKAKKIVGIEKNTVAHNYAVENMKLNKTDNVELIEGDVRKVLPDEKFDRIIMPLPKSAEDFLDVALRNSKKGTIIHFYDFLDESEIPDVAVEKIKLACKKNKIGYKVLNHVKCGQFSPGTFRICIDFKVI